MKLTSIKKGLLATAAAGVLAVGMAGGANAEVIARAGMLITDGVVLNGAGARVDTASFSALTVTNSGSTSTGLAGFASGGTSMSVSSPAASVAVELPVACSGPAAACGGVVDRSLTFGPAGFPLGSDGGSASHTSSDSALNGSLVTNVGGSFGLPPTPADLVVGTGALPGVRPVGILAGVASEARLKGDISGNATSTTGTTSGFTFSLASPGAITFEFYATLDLMADLTAADPGTNDATASSKFQIKVTRPGAGGAVVTEFQWNPDGGVGGPATDTNVFGEVDPFALNDTATTSTVGTFDSGGNFPGGPGFFSATTPTLGTGVSYTLAITQEASVLAAAAAVPAPGTLGLLGAGLVALGVARRRMVKKAA